MSDTIPWWAFPGNKVVCVDAVPHPTRPVLPGVQLFNSNLSGLTKGTTYTVKDVFLNPCRGYHQLRLVEIERQPSYHPTVGHYHSGFFFGRFRPVTSQDGNIETAFYYGKNRHAKQPHKEPA